MNWINRDCVVGPPGAAALTPGGPRTRLWKGGPRVTTFACVSVCKQMRPLQAASPHCSSSSSYTPLSDSAAPHSLEDGGLRFTVRWGALVLCLQLPDRKLRQPGKMSASPDARDLGLPLPGACARVAACGARYARLMRLSPACQQHLRLHKANRLLRLRMCVCVRANAYYVLTCGFHVFLRRKFHVGHGGLWRIKKA